MSRIKKLLNLFVPPKQWRFAAIVLLGITGGLTLHILFASNAVSYLSDDPRTCINCHVMTPQFASWERGSHGKVATCNDCHVPQDNIIKTYWFKANDGLRHATMFTFRLEPQVIRIKDAGKTAVQDNCIRCHTNLIHPVSIRAISNENVADQREGYCWDCHRSTPHGRVNSLSSTPYVQIAEKYNVVPEWMQKSLKENKTNKEKE